MARYWQSPRLILALTSFLRLRHWVTLLPFKALPQKQACALLVCKQVRAGLAECFSHTAVSPKPWTLTQHPQALPGFQTPSDDFWSDRVLRALRTSDVLKSLISSEQASFPPNSPPHTDLALYRPCLFPCLRESEWKDPDNSLHPLFLLRLLERAGPPEERNLREMLPSSGKHTPQRPQTATISSLSVILAGENAQLSILRITRKGCPGWNAPEAENRGPISRSDHYWNLPWKRGSVPRGRVGISGDCRHPPASEQDLRLSPIALRLTNPFPVCEFKFARPLGQWLSGQVKLEHLPCT